MSADPTVDDARHLLDWISRNAAAYGRFTRRDLFTSVHSSRFAKVTDLEPGLGILEQHGYIHRRDETSGARGGRPSVSYLIHPAVAPAEPAEPAEPL